MAGYLLRVYHTRASTQLLQSMIEAITVGLVTEYPRIYVCMPRQTHNLEKKKKGSIYGQDCAKHPPPMG